MLQDLFDGTATFKRPTYSKDVSKGEKITGYTTIATLPMQATPGDAVSAMYETDVHATLTPWEVIVLAVGFVPEVAMQITLNGVNYDGQVVTITGIQKYGNPGSTIPLHYAIQAEEYKNSGA